MKHFNSFRTLLTVCLLALTAQLNAADTLIDGLYYILHADEHTASLSGLADKTIASLEIPSTVESDGISYNVTRVENYALSNCSSLQSLSVPATIVSMNTTLEGCTALKELTLQDGSLPLEMYSTFATEKLEKLYLGRNLTTYINIPFSNSKEALSSLAIGPQVTELPDDLFSGCSNLTVVELPHVKTIGSGCFQDCPRLTALSLGDSLESVGHAAFSNCKKLVTIVLGNLSLSNNLASVGEQSFMNCKSLAKVALPASLDALSSETFARCSALADVDLGNTLNTIGPGAFKDCTSLENIGIPKSVYGFGVESFRGCTALKDINLTEGINAIVSDYATPSGNNSGCWYTLQGMRIGGKPSKAGIYVHQGRKVVVRR